MPRSEDYTSTDDEKPRGKSKGKGKSSRGLPAFLQKLATIVNDEELHDQIHWSEDGMSFIVPSQEKLSAEVLPRYFKHSNFGSLVRQLNMYGFRKQPKLNAGALKTSFKTDELEFRHEYFQRDHPELMHKITRKKAGDDAPHGSSDAQVQNLLARLEVVTERQDALAREFQVLAGTNKALWDEQQAVKAKYDHQQQAISSIINFLAIEYNGRVQLDEANGRELPAANAVDRMNAVAEIARTAPVTGPSRARAQSSSDRMRLGGPSAPGEARLEEMSDVKPVIPTDGGGVAAPRFRTIEAAQAEQSRSASPLPSDQSEARFSLLPDSPPTLPEPTFQSAPIGNARGAVGGLTGPDPPLSGAIGGSHDGSAPTPPGLLPFDTTSPNTGALVPYDQSGRGLDHVRADMAKTELSIEQILAEIDALGGVGTIPTPGAEGGGEWSFSDFLKASGDGASSTEVPTGPTEASDYIAHAPTRKRKSSGASAEISPAAKRGKA